MKTPASPTGREIRENITRFLKEYGGTLTARDLADYHQYPISNVCFALEKLTTQGVIERTGKVATPVKDGLNGRKTNYVYAYKYKPVAASKESVAPDSAPVVVRPMARGLAWSKQEDAIIKQYYPNGGGPIACQPYLARTKHAIQSRAGVLGIVKTTKRRRRSKNPDAVALGAQSLTAEQRSAIASKAAMKRWHNGSPPPLPVATKSEPGVLQWIWRALVWNERA